MLQQVDEELRLILRAGTSGGLGISLAATGDVEALFRAAAAGDHDAQCAIALDLLAQAEAGICSPREAAIAAECYARLAATSDLPAHLVRLAMILMIRGTMSELEGRPADKAACEGEALFLYDQAASQGDADAEAHLQRFADAISPEAAAYAARLHKRAEA